MTFYSSFFLPQPNIEAQFLGMNADLVNLDLLGTAPVMAPQESSQGPSPANPFGLPATSSNSTASFGKPVGNPFESNKPAAPTLIQLAGGSTGFGGKLLFYPSLLPPPHTTLSSPPSLSHHPLIPSSLSHHPLTPPSHPLLPLTPPSHTTLSSPPPSHTTLSSPPPSHITISTPPPHSSGPSAAAANTGRHDNHRCRWQQYLPFPGAHLPTHLHKQSSI